MPHSGDALALLERAMAIAAAAHRGQTDKAGRPRLAHCRRVAAAVDGLPEKTVAWLHDVVEKSENWSTMRLEADGFPGDVVRAVDAMTRRPGEDYFDFARRAASDPLARPVKRADLQDNLRQAQATGADGGKYAEALDLLKREGLL
jgi:(p)ppGpp synthase/HD superfamily hydrolase